jgi:hypothetical protein
MGLKNTEPVSPSCPTLEVHIERIVLHGYSPGDTHRLGEVLEAELSRLVQNRGIDRSAVNNRSIERIDGGSIKLASPPKIDTLGVKLAGNVHQLLAPVPGKMPTRIQANPHGGKR